MGVATDTNILLSHAFCPSLCRYGLATKKIACVSITSSLMQQCHAARLVAVTKFKTTKINFKGLFGLFTKIRPHENYPPYGIQDFRALTDQYWRHVRTVHCINGDRRHLASKPLRRHLHFKVWWYCGMRLPIDHLYSNMASGHLSKVTKKVIM